MADPFIQQLFLSPWSGAPARGQLPQVPQRPALDTASEALVGCLVRIPGASGVADATYECQKQADGSYAWVQVDGGSAGPLGLLGRASGTSITVDATTRTVASVTGLVISAGRAIKLTCRGFLQLGAADTTASFAWVRGVTNLNFIPAAIVGSVSQAWPLNDTYVDEPAAGTYTYSLTVTSAAATGSCGATIYVEDIGVAVP